ncbi:uncharacterized protein B0T15DRAFT_540967 [Chaetomium strumarium]|uniref:Dihydroxyacid dehydratase n=1 Tax=Chaetomium strumarium TaxID=1170767 RepID=A0AAJ0GPD6_9PEZI|nr:hypothetical protein B0T15DRAFT_540967 [Chaetomium strumarium]
MAAAHPEVYDLLVVTDATHSMKYFLQALNSSLKDVIRISAATGCFSRIGVLAYRDYDKRNAHVTEWSGWYSREGNTEAGISRETLLSFVNNLSSGSGYDFPEAAKSGLAHAYQVMRRDAKTIILLFADAPPHTEPLAGLWATEQRELLRNASFGETGKRFADWTSAASTLSRGDKRAQVFSIIALPHRLGPQTSSMFTYLSARTGGACIAFRGRTPTSDVISEVTVCLLLAWMGAGKEGATLKTEKIVDLVRFVDVSGIEQIRSERDPHGAQYLLVSDEHHDRKALEIVERNMEYSPLSLETMAQIIPRREHPVMGFAMRYKADPEYQAVVIEQLSEIIESDVSALALNPVFGSLWRTVCNDRRNPARDKLLARFGFQVERIGDEAKKSRMKAWLEESYDYVGEILETIKSVPEGARYPCVFLDPTVRFMPAAGDGVGDTDESMEFTRDELLEIGRSCDPRILRRLGRILTRLTYVTSQDQLPAHVRDVPEEEVPRIPMALAQPEHKRKFWQVLLHVVVPGTMVTARPAALLAALSLRMGIKPLEEVAHSELMAFRDKWNTLEIPETWNTACLTLLLEADKNHTQLKTDVHADGTTTVLKAEDRRLFEALVNYKLLDMNMDTTLTAKVGWTPDKSKMPLGPVVMCSSCEFPRSVTIMAEDGVCGLCAVQYESKDARAECTTANVSKADNSSTLATWTECSMADCRAQYVLYNPGQLNVRPKCHYCRQASVVSTQDPSSSRLPKSPCVTCTRCANRIIWPEAYRPGSWNPADFKCPGCETNPDSTIATEEVTPLTVARSNGTAWLLRNDDNAIPAPLTKRSVFHTVSTLTIDRSLFADKVEVLPKLQVVPLAQQPAAADDDDDDDDDDLTTSTPLLTIRGKPLHNTPALLAELRSWVSARRVQAGTCSLCFRDRAKRDLRLACGGRRGCRQMVCAECVQGWYGMNRIGRIINLAALSCPFCRRQPTSSSKVSSLPGGLRFLGGLRDAVAERGEWVYAWCGGCGMAKRFAERVCARGAPEEVEEWRCEECVLAAEQTAGGGGGGQGGMVIKECPSCGVATQKMVGCDHISCPCGAHWCFNCGVQTEEGEIYGHMSTEHRTWYVDGNGEDFVDYYDDEAYESD